MEAFTFGDPIPVLDKREIFDYLECVQIDNYYEPPISFNGLARTFRAAPHHSSAIYVKRNILTSTFIPNKYLSRQTFDSWALDFLLFGNGYLEERNNRLGQSLNLKHSPAKFTRRGVDLETYWFVQYGYDIKPYEFQTGKVFHLIEPDINQELYGLPEYLAAIPSVLLNESATLFRRKYYLNGSHAGYILYISDAAQKTDDVDKIREALKSSKGPGNFRNLFLYAPGERKTASKLFRFPKLPQKMNSLILKM